MVQVVRTTLTKYQHLQAGAAAPVLTTDQHRNRGGNHGGNRGGNHPPSSMFYLVGTLNLLATLLQNGGRDVIDAAIGRRSDR